ncbi:MAG: hypothetical protein RIR26_2581 [Pseudomonadota bacterium]|jgi:hypothetical protein
MQARKPIDDYLTAELESERCKFLSRNDSAVTVSAQDNGKDIWTILSLLPSRLERVQLASHLEISAAPDSSWSICTYLLRDAEQDVVGNAINAMTRSRVRSIAHRAFHYLKSPERPQRILYCLARYSEEACDGRISEQLAPTLASDLSDAYLARSFNALYRHGVLSDSAINVSKELVFSHIDATNMDRKAAVAALTYLFFAGDMACIENLKSIHSRITIPELRRLLSWGFKDIASLAENDSATHPALSAEKFWSVNFSHFDPTYCGYGCFSDTELVNGLAGLDEKGALPEPATLTERVLKLGNKSCIEWLAGHSVFGIERLYKHAQEQKLFELWKLYCPQGIPTFKKNILNLKHAEFWHSQSPELFAIHLEDKDLLPILNEFPKWLEQIKSFDRDLILNLLIGIFLALEANSESLTEKHKIGEFFDKIRNEIEEQISKSKDNRSANRDKFIASIMGSNHKEIFPVNLFNGLLDSVSWIDIATAHLHEVDDRFHIDLIERFEQAARSKVSHSDPDKFGIELARMVAISILAASAPQQKQAFEKILQFSSLTELLDPNRNVTSLQAESSEELQEADDVDSPASDWSGQVVVDHPVARWGAILFGILQDDLLKRNLIGPASITPFENLLKESMRTAPHVEKRWVAKALAKIGSDDSVKTLLYQGLQHIDSDFVGLTIRELLPSMHPRAQQALIRCVGRNAIPDELKLNILEEISIHNPSEILQELKTLEILRLPQHIDDAVRDAVGRVAALLDESGSQNSASLDGTVVRISGPDVETIIRNLLPDVDLLNIDARSALRTAETILMQSRGWSQGGMDLSPIVNMHCKAVELVLRDTFEPFTDAILRKGLLSRKLDILGYARPIPEKMQIFEDCLANLPVIRTIPYFSKFKLRKMLRAICLYRPGKRFTLDGPKAFALFFLVTARKSCPFGLEGMFNLSFANDTLLFEYIKLIHSLQDSRNRAVHEGLTWEAKDEIESMRSQAFKVIEISMRLKKGLNAMENSNSPAGAGTLGMGA